MHASHRAQFIVTTLTVANYSSDCRIAVNYIKSNNKRGGIRTDLATIQSQVGARSVEYFDILYSKIFLIFKILDMLRVAVRIIILTSLASQDKFRYLSWSLLILSNIE